MNWLYFALISSVTLSLREITVKKASKDLSALFMSWAMNLIMFVIFLVINISIRNLHPVNLTFVGILLIASVLDSLAMILYLKSIRSGDLSKAIPMLCFIPVVQLFVAPLLVNEKLTIAGIAGVITVVFGSYLLYVDKFDGLLAPFKSISTNKSSLMMLQVAFLWGISTSFHKIGVNLSDPLFWGVSEMGLISIILFVFALRANQATLSIVRLKSIFLPSVFSSVAVLSYYAAISLGPVAYVSSVRRLGVLFSMLTGIILLKEKQKKLGIAGGMIMIFGAAIISIYG